MAANGTSHSSILVRHVASLGIGYEPSLGRGHARTQGRSVRERRMQRVLPARPGGHTGHAGRAIQLACIHRSMGSQMVSAIGLGAWQFGESGWGWGSELKYEEAQRIVQRGVDFFITAEAYGGVRSEEILGEALQGTGSVSPSTISRKYPLSRSRGWLWLCVQLGVPQPTRREGLW